MLWYIFLIVGIIAGLKAIGNKNRIDAALDDAERDANIAELSIIVQCMMSEGVYYKSTKSAKPLYDKEIATYSIKNTRSFHNLHRRLVEYGCRDWDIDLRNERERWMNENLTESEIRSIHKSEEEMFAQDVRIERGEWISRNIGYILLIGGGCLIAILVLIYCLALAFERSDKSTDNTEHYVSPRYDGTVYYDESFDYNDNGILDGYELDAYEIWLKEQ